MAVEKSPAAESVPRLIRDLQAELRSARRHPAQLHELAQRELDERLDAAHEILEWAKRDRRWSFTLAEIMTHPVSRARELASRLVLAIVEELEQERETLDEIPVVSAGPSAP
jgi:hypothetical protein